MQSTTIAQVRSQRVSAKLIDLAAHLEDVGVSGELELPGGDVARFGMGVPVVRVIFRSEKALRAAATEIGLARAYMVGEIDVEGDFEALMAIRDRLNESTSIAQQLLLGIQLLLPATWMNARAVDHHYTLGDDFYLSFLDERYHFYSHGLFQSPDESLEEASEHKLESMWRALGLEAGMHLLDIGGGWGGLSEYCGRRGVRVTSLTLTQDSARFIDERIRRHDLPCQVRVEDVLDHVPEQPYDHAVIYGVIEHVPNYRRFVEKVWSVLPPGGRLYMDASAAMQKFAASAFIRRHIWRGHHSFLCVQDIVRELLYGGFEVLEVKAETRDYALTMVHWAKRFDAAREQIVEGWGEKQFRMFRIYLWAGAHAFRTNRLQAYHLVSERRVEPGPRPGLAARSIEFARSLH